MPKDEIIENIKEDKNNSANTNTNNTNNDSKKYYCENGYTKSSNKCVKQEVKNASIR